MSDAPKIEPTPRDTTHPEAVDQAKTAPATAKDLQQDKEIRKTRWATGILAVATLATTTWAAVSNHRQANMYREQLDDARKSARESAAVIDHQMKLAELQAQIAGSQARSVAVLADETRKQLTIAQQQADSMASQDQSISRQASATLHLAEIGERTDARQEKTAQVDYATLVQFSGLSMALDGDPGDLGRLADLKFSIKNASRVPVADVQVKEVNVGSGGGYWKGEMPTISERLALRPGEVAIASTQAFLPGTFSRKVPFEDVMVVQAKLVYTDMAHGQHTASGCFTRPFAIDDDWHFAGDFTACKW
jgi:hypothetical protein